MSSIEKNTGDVSERSSEKGSAIVLALFVLALVGAFVAISLTRTSTEAAAMGNEASEGRTFYSSQGCLEMMTRNFNKIFETKLKPTQPDIDRVLDAENFPGLSTTEGGQFTFLPELDQTKETDGDDWSYSSTIETGDFAGLYALRDNWRLRCTGTDTTTNTQVQLTRNILNNRVPIFQFGIFYDDDLELYRPPLFSFGGRVHTNRHFFISPGADEVYFDSKVTAVGHIVTESWRNGATDTYSGTYIKDASGTFRQLSRTSGSVKNGSGNILRTDPANTVTDFPASILNPTWNATKATFDGNLQNKVNPLKLPLKIGEEVDQSDLIEMIKRGKSPAAGTFLGDSNNIAAPAVAPDIVAVTDTTKDNDILKSERFANKPGIRISLSDSKQKLPGCATVTGANPCGVRLDGHKVPRNATADSREPETASATLDLRSRGYQPRGMKLDSSATAFNYVPTRVNGERLNFGNQVWIKVETVAVDETTGAIVTRDITEEFLSLGVTEVPSNITVGGSGTGDCAVGSYSGRMCLQGYTGSLANNGTAAAPSTNLTADSVQTASTYPDSRSIIKLQRFEIPALNPESSTTSQIPNYNGTPATNRFVSYYNNQNVVVRYTNATHANFGTTTTNFVTTTWCGATLLCTDADRRPTLAGLPVAAPDYERFGHLKRANINGTQNLAIVPFPIKMFDSREGLYYDERSTTYYSNTNYDSYRKLSRNGVMSLVDIDVANLRRFLRGDYDGLFPTGTPFYDSNSSQTLKHTDIPENGGWVLYVSDRRGDYDFDGEFDMEDIYGAAPGNNDTLNNGEDSNFNALLDRRFCASGTSITCETERYSTRASYPDVAAVIDQQYYRRGVRLINGTVVPGKYDATTPANTLGFTVASENGVYVKGNYNSTGLSAPPPATANSPYNQYQPFNNTNHIPASIVADGITILSNSWNDSQSFITALLPTNPSQSRVASNTTVRFAMISGDTIATKVETPHQGSSVNGERMNGGVHNFKRFLEHWAGKRLDYAGSLINLFNSRNANGAFKCCALVYNPPRRNWVFDSTFLDPTRLPPGTPFFQYIDTTGFERTNH